MYEYLHILPRKTTATRMYFIKYNLANDENKKKKMWNLPRIRHKVTRFVSDYRVEEKSVEYQLRRQREFKFLGDLS